MRKLRYRNLSDLQGLVASELSQIGCPRGDLHAGSVQGNGPRINTQRAEKEAELGGRRFGCDVVSTKASVNPMGHSGAKMALHSFPE